MNLLMEGKTMILSIFSDFFDYLNNKFSGQVPNLIYFAIGAAIGIFLFFIILLIIYLLAKPKQKIKEKIIQKNIVIHEEYKNVILANIDIYKNVYQQAEIKNKIEGLGKIILNMMESISSLYYPESSDPMFEISLEQLVDFLSYSVSRINFIIDKLLQERLQIVDVLTNHSLKDKKISFVFEMIDKKKNVELEEKPKKIGLFGKIKSKFIHAGKKVATKIGGNIMNVEFEEIIQTFGEDINKLYSKQELVFTDLTKKEKKLLLRKSKLKKEEDIHD